MAPWAFFQDEESYRAKQVCRNMHGTSDWHHSNDLAKKQVDDKDDSVRQLKIKTSKGE